MNTKQEHAPPTNGVVGSLQQTSVEEHYHEPEDWMWIDRTMLEPLLKQLFQDGALTMQAFWTLCEFFEL